ncbi:heavy metal translocating P-type ATPase [Carnobacterium antarcticum]|uniref:Heavy metal translocating P-type ATPase n=1 Tax=Carnobacterium antarcticum TaxID=2126436 RepID=A0ABW4NM48_9LACT|nr:heavy metal translocating P-type ATPase [Carnobacterium sp. CP1]ALV21730.1 Lead, cadmium, zinc and mercury transporting ATPase [Carnobacterium sp. CP1]
MRGLIKDNKPMVATILSGLLIALGLFLSVKANYEAAALIYILSFMIGGFYQAKEGLKNTVENKQLNVDILMILAAIGASIIGFWMEGALLIFIFSLSGSLEVYATNKSTKAITDLINLTPETAHLVHKDGSITEVPTASLSIGDQLMIPKGANIPIDGVLLTKNGLIDESAISGEAIPIEKTDGDELIGGTINLSEAIMMQVTKDSSDTLFAKVLRMVDEAQSTPSKTATMIEAIENKYVLIVLIFVPVMIAIFYFVLQWDWNESFYRGMVLLTVASPCALVASAAPATLAAISNGARKGILFKGGSYLENFGQINAIAFDKTGTLTEGKPVVTDTCFKSGENEQTIMSICAALEKTSTHPIAKAIVQAFSKSSHTSLLIENINDHTGYGLTGTALGSEWRIGKKEYIVNEADSPFIRHADKIQKEGKTVIYVSRDGQVVAYFGLLDMPKKDAQSMVAYFKAHGIHTVMITGDNSATGETIGQMLGVDEVKANCLPHEKAELIMQLKKQYGTIAMVGDGINDAPALANASIGIAMGAGTDIAIDVADVVLMKDDLNQLPASFRLSNQLKKITLQNIIFAITVIVLLILSNLFQVITLPLGVIGHEGSTLLVILNGLRLLRTTSKIDD